MFIGRYDEKLVESLPSFGIIIIWVSINVVGQYPSQNFISAKGPLVIFLVVISPS